jgi:hypothetical protein
MASTNDEVLGPAFGFRVAGNFLRQLPADNVVGYYRRHQWWVKDKPFTSYECRDRCVIYFQDTEGTRTEVFGPYQKITAPDGTMYADADLFAKFMEESILWHSYVLDTYWPSLVIADPAPTSGTRV